MTSTNAITSTVTTGSFTRVIALRLGHICLFVCFVAFYIGALMGRGAGDGVECVCLGAFVWVHRFASFSLSYSIFLLYSFTPIFIWW